MEAALVPKQPRARLPNQLLLYLMSVPLGLGLGMAVAFKPTIGLGLAVIPVLSILIFPKPKLGLYFIAALLPFETMTVLGTDLTAVKLVAVITLIAWLTKISKSGLSNLHPASRNNIILIFFLAIAAFSCLQADNASLAFGRLLTLCLLVVIYFVALDLIDGDKTIQNLMLVLVCSGSLAAGIQLALLFGGQDPRQVGISIDPNHSALNILILVPLAFALIGRYEKVKPLFWLAPVLLVGGSVVLLSRGALVSLLVIFLLMSFEKSLKKNVRVMIVAFLVALISLGLVFMVIDKRFSIDSMKSTSGSGRGHIWKSGLDILKDKPFLGIGLEGFKQTRLEYVARTRSVPQGHLQKPLYAHSLFVQVAVETGLVGFGAFFMFLGACAVRTLRARRVFMASSDYRQAANASMLLISLAGLLVGLIFLDGLTKKLLWLLLAMTVAQSRTFFYRPTPSKLAIKA